MFNAALVESLTGKVRQEGKNKDQLAMAVFFSPNRES